MPAAINVKPGAWSELSVLYDDGMYSVVWGRFRKSQLKSLGVRWNGIGDEKGYPNMGKNPLWYREPEFLIVPILRGLLEKYAEAAVTPQSTAYRARVELALREAEEQGSGIHSPPVLI